MKEDDKQGRDKCRGLRFYNELTKFSWKIFVCHFDRFLAYSSNNMQEERGQTSVLCWYRTNVNMDPLRCIVIAHLSLRLLARTLIKWSRKNVNKHGSLTSIFQFNFKFSSILKEENRLEDLSVNGKIIDDYNWTSIFRVGLCGLNSFCKGHLTWRALVNIMMNLQYSWRVRILWDYFILRADDSGRAV